MKQCTKCKEYFPTSAFGVKSWINKDGSKTTKPKSHCRKCINTDNLKRYHENPSTKSAHRSASYRHRIKSYGLTFEEYDNLLESQDSSCAVCGSKPNRSLVIDHCHTTGKVRGLLCDLCNKALGNVKDNVGTLKGLIKYLEKSNE